MGLVRSIAHRYRDRGLALDDLVQEGALGLLNAVDNYDPNRGTTFSTYAFWRIRGAITHALTTDAHVVRIPRPVLERQRRVAAARERLRGEGHASTLRKLAEATNLSSRELAEALEPRYAYSLDEPTPDGRLLGDILSDVHSPDPAAQLLAGVRTRAVHVALRRLSPRKRTILRRHFGLVGRSATLTEIGADLRLSPERVRGLKDEALRELADDLEDELAAAG